MVEDGDAICASLLQLRNAFWPKPTKMACQNAVSATFLARDAVNADFLAVEGLHRNAAVCHCVYFLDCPDCRVPLCSFSRVFFPAAFLERYRLGRMMHHRQMSGESWGCKRPLVRFWGTAA